MLGTGDEVVLQILGQFREVGAVARDADDEAAVLFRILLGIDQGLAVDHVELHMPQPQVHEGADEAHQLAGTFLAGQAAGGELVMLSFPSQIIILAVVALLGVDIRNVVIASIFIKWAWYARMIRTATIKYTGMNFVLFSRSIGSGNFYILTRHMLPCIAAELAVLASLDTGWAILNISTLSFLGLGVQAPVPEWGAMLNEAKNVMVSNPEQMIVPGIAVVVLVGAFNMLGDCLRDALDPKAVRQ